ncbi:MAG: undecaprenyldiphospho-muramoylpentapeptide beta-N-acetylglucosaminyltransferase [Vicinamibacterales bacterium]
MRVLFAGGGTGGHLYPGIAVAEELRRRDPATVVSFVGTARGLESRVVPALGLSLDLIRSAGLKGKSPAALARGLALLPLSALDAWRVLSRRRPDVVVGVGGYSSGPVLLLAALRRLPTLVMEQNTAPGFTNRVLARWVSAAALSYDETLRFFPGIGIVTGNPVRRQFLDGRSGDEPVDAAGGKVRVLIVGGSQGARAVNDALVAAAPRLAAAAASVAITHQTGERDLARVRDAYAAAGCTAIVAPFLHDMHAQMAAADLVVSRAGASSLAELTVLGRPMLLVPLPTAADDHQRKNAAALARAGAAEVIDEGELNGDRLADALLALAADSGTRRRMAAAARAQGRPDAAARVADRIAELAGVR